MSRTTWLIPAGLAIGAALSFAPALLARFRMARRIAGDLRAWQRAAEITPQQLAAFDDRVGVISTTSVLDERTWEDLHLADVFARIDHCVSQPGRQYLYHMLRHPSLTAATLPAFNEAVTALQQDAATMGTVRETLRPLHTRAAASLEAAFFGTLPARPSLWWMFPVLTSLSLLLLVVVSIWPPVILVWLLICCVNVIGQAVYRPRVREFVPAMTAMRDFVQVAERLGQQSLRGLEQETATLRVGSARLRAMKSTTGWLRFDTLSANEIVGTLYEWGNMLFALDITAFVLTTTRLAAERDEGQAMFRAIGRIDALCAVAEWRQQLPVWSAPEFSAPTNALHAVDCVHPLLDDGVANTLQLQHAGLLVTGSNMSGKTTFLRALGVNAVLAHAVGTVCARAWTAPELHVRTSMGQGDNLLEGKSFYLAEIESVKRMLDLAGSGTPHLFLVDELFRGTNTPERVAAGYATIAWLNRGTDLVCVATHDLELHGMLGDAFATYHFREQVFDGALTFDYRMRDGLSSSRNAIAMLEHSGFPPELVANALGALRDRVGVPPAALPQD